jgi:hypothetical protein
MPHRLTGATLAGTRGLSGGYPAVFGSDHHRHGDRLSQRRQRDVTLVPQVVLAPRECNLEVEIIVVSTRQSTPAISTRHTGPFRNIAPSKRTNTGTSPGTSQ